MCAAAKYWDQAVVRYNPMTRRASWGLDLGFDFDASRVFDLRWILQCFRGIRQYFYDDMSSVNNDNIRDSRCVRIRHVPACWHFPALPTKFLSRFAHSCRRSGLRSNNQGGDQRETLSRNNTQTRGDYLLVKMDP